MRPKSPGSNKNVKAAKYSVIAEQIEEARVHDIDELIEFEKFKKDILPALREDLKNKLSVKEILEKYKALVAAKQITLALTSSDEKIANSAANAILDRTEGKAKETKTVKHEGLEDLSEDELERMVQSKVKDLKEENEYDH